MFSVILNPPVVCYLVQTSKSFNHSMTHVPKTSVRSLIENKKTPNVKKDEGVLVRGTTFNSSRGKVSVMNSN